MEPIYTAKNCRVAFQLNWSLSVFGTSDLPPSSVWLAPLSKAVAADGLRILEVRSIQSNVFQLFISSVPQIAASEIVRSIKGRWQYLLKEASPSAFRRNYRIDSVGSANSDTLDRYIAGQNVKHRMADPRVQAHLSKVQFHDSTIDLTKVRKGNYGLFVNCLQVVLENAGNWNEIREDVLLATREMIIRASRKKRWQLSRIGLLSDHIHILLGVGMTESPESVALSLLNNLASVQEMRPAFKFSYYVGTFGRYDRQAVRSKLS